MADQDVIFRLNVIIALLLAVLAVLLWPLVPTLLGYGVVAAVLAGIGLMVYGLANRDHRTRTRGR